MKVLAVMLASCSGVRFDCACSSGAAFFVPESTAPLCAIFYVTFSEARLLPSSDLSG
jgi:hypothetical protein